MHPVDQMYAGIRQTFALFGDIEIPSGARIRQAGNDFPQIMHAAQENSRLLFGARDWIAEHFGVASQGVEQPDERVVPPSHHVRQHQPPLLRQRKRRLEPRQIRGLDDCWLVG